MKFKTLDDFSFENKLVIVRSDLNSEVVNGKVIPGPRIKESSKTISELKEKKARVIVIAHQGRKGSEDFISLEQHSRLLNKHVKIRFVKGLVGKKTLSDLVKIKKGEAVLLENIRYYPQEEEGTDNGPITKILGKIGEIYVNDAFSVCHRKHASISILPEMMPSCIGRTMQTELEGLSKIKLRDCLYIIGGNKTEEALLLMGKNEVLACGTLASLCLIAKGKNLGYENEYLKNSTKYLKEIKTKMKKVILPIDFALEIDGKRIEKDLNDFPADYKIKDLGTKTIKLYEEKIKQAKAIFFKGIPGLCDSENFCKGTRTLLKAVEKSRAFSVFSGGSIITYMDRFGINPKKIGYISMSGGATVFYLTGKKLPGLEALKLKGLR